MILGCLENADDNIHVVYLTNLHFQSLISYILVRRQTRCLYTVTIPWHLELPSWSYPRSRELWQRPAQQYLGDNGSPYRPS